MKSIRLFLAGPLLAASTLACATTTGLSDSAENSFIDFYFRGQSWTAPATQYLGLTTETCSDSSNGTEPSSGSYARVSVTSSLANWAGTQSSGSTTASTGTGGTTSNNGAVTFPTSTGAWASSANLQAVRSYSASSSGTMLWCIDLTSPIAVTASGFTLSFSAGSLQFTRASPGRQAPLCAPWPADATGLTRWRRQT